MATSPRGGDAEAWNALKSMLAARVEESLGGRLSSESVHAIVEEELSGGKRA